MKNKPHFIEMKQSDIKILKEKIWRENDKKCPVLQREVPLDKMVLDHIHKRKDDKYDVDRGTIRTALEFRVNAFFGKIENAYKRYGLKDEMSLSNLLRKGADYLDQEPYCEGDNYFVHPSEIPKREVVKTNEYKRVAKYYLAMFPKRKKVIKRPKYVTDEWKSLVALTEEYIRTHGK